MKKSPQQQKLDEMLHSSQLVSGGFFGTDTRSLSEIIDHDLAEIEHLGYTTQDIAARMEEITRIAKTGLGTMVHIDDNLEACTQENRGILVCPWPHNAYTSKTVTVVHHKPTGKTIKWADMCVHLIKEHGFFQGRGSVFRNEPELLINLIFST